MTGPVPEIWKEKTSLSMRCVEHRVDSNNFGKIPLAAHGADPSLSVPVDGVHPRQGPNNY